MALRQLAHSLWCRIAERKVTLGALTEESHLEGGGVAGEGVGLEVVGGLALGRRRDLVVDGVGGGDGADVAEVDEARLVERGAGLGVDLVAVELAAAHKHGPK